MKLTMAAPTAEVLARYHVTCRGQAGAPWLRQERRRRPTARCRAVHPELSRARCSLLCLTANISALDSHYGKITLPCPELICEADECRLSARSTRGIRHAPGRNRDLPLLYRVDSFDGILHYVLSLEYKLTLGQPFVDPDHPLHDLFPPRVWAIRIPVILTLLGSAVVGSFLGIVMIKGSRKKAVKAKAAGKKKA